uniref:Reverse transcriptase domain-containing protein n=1 Tax=Tanacetum cinerariifolium TaxID=118510 RepID=A0A6L2LN21_TANCI|nr:reverse transcriptase domain-containing protein [Tanacetum cinerariifolium]
MRNLVFADLRRIMLRTIKRYSLNSAAQSSSAVASLCISSGNLSSLAVESCSGSGKSSLAVGMPCAFYSQQRDLRTLIMEEAHATKYSVHPGAEIGEGKMIGLEMKQETTKVVVIKERLKEAKDHQERVKLIAPPTSEYVPDPIELKDHAPGRIRRILEVDPADYLADGGDDGDSSNDDDDDDDVEVDEKEDEEHLAHVDSTTVASPAINHVPFAKETQPFETNESAATSPPPPAYRVTARMSIRSQAPIPFPSEEEVAILLALPTPPPSPLTPLSSPLPQIPSPPTSLTYAQASLSCRSAMMRATPSPIPLPSSFLPSPIRPPHTRAAMAQMRAAAPPTYHSLLPVGTPSLLPIPLPAPSTCRRAGILEADMSPRKGLLLTAPIPWYKVRESSAAGTARRAMTAIEVVNLRVSYQAHVRRRESEDFYSQHQDAREDHVDMRAEIKVLMKERLAYEQEISKTHQALRQDSDDRATVHIMHTQALEARARIDTLEDAGCRDLLFISSYLLRYAKYYGSPPASIALERDADRNRNEEDSHDSASDERRQAPTARERTYSDFLKCQPLNLKGTGVDVRFTDMRKKYVGGLPDMIYGSVMATKPKTMQDVIEFETKLMDKKGLGKRNRMEDLNLCVLSATITMMGSVLPSAQTTRGLAIRHLIVKASLLLPTTTREPKGQIKEFSLALSVELRATSGVIAQSTAGTNPKYNVVTSAFLLNNRYTSILFDTDADRSFVSTAFSSLIDIVPITLDHGYDVELADGISQGLAGYPTNLPSGISNQFGTWCCTCSKSALSISSVRDERTVGSTKRTYRQGLYKTQFLTLGSSGLVCQEEGWIIPDVHMIELSFHHNNAHKNKRRKVGDKELRRGSRFNFSRTSLTGFPAQSIRSSNAIAVDSSNLLVLITGTSQSKQHGKSESDSYYLSD